MTYNDTTLVVVGDSFVYGHLGDDVDIESCHNRSWVRQLEKIGNFKTSVNLGAPGGSNYRSIRVLYEYLDQHYGPDEKYLVIFAASEMTRFELPVNDHVGRRYSIVYDNPDSYANIHDEIKAATLGSWCLHSDNSIKRSEPGTFYDFLSMYYASFNDDIYSEKILRNSLFSLKAMLDNLNIKSFFTSSILLPETLDNMSFLGEKLPSIKYFYKPTLHDNIGQFLGLMGFKRYPCSHYDEQAYIFLAKYIYENYLTKE